MPIQSWQMKCGESIVFLNIYQLSGNAEQFFRCKIFTFERRMMQNVETTFVAESKISTYKVSVLKMDIQFWTHYERYGY